LKVLLLAKTTLRRTAGVLAVGEGCGDPLIEPTSLAQPICRDSPDEGKYKGRKPTARAKADQITKLAAAGKSRGAIAAQLEVGVASVYRVLSSARG
jgi:DNA invertase Pin-like site-specific DNA recombinase